MGLFCKRWLLVVMLGFISGYINAQDTLSYFCDRQGVMIAKDSASFYRKAIQEGTQWHVSDYYLSGKLKCEGDYNNSNEKVGHFVYYFENGNKFREGDYYKNFKIGKWSMWYEDGKIKAEENYIKDIKVVEKLVTEGAANVPGISVKVALYFLLSKGIYADTSQWYFHDGRLSQMEVWDKKLTFLKQANASGYLIKSTFDKQDWEDYLIVYPEFTGDLRKMARSRKIRYTDNIFDRESITLIQFEVSSEGDVSNIRKNDAFEQTYFNSLKELILMTDKMWTPGKRHNLVADFVTSLVGSGNIGSIDLTKRNHGLQEYEY